MFPVASYDPETLRLLTGAFEDAWRATQEMLGKKPLDELGIRTYLANRIMRAADRGERDPRRLKLIAIGAIEA
jgi:hypothetical protein